MILDVERKLIGSGIFLVIIGVVLFILGTTYVCTFGIPGECYTNITPISHLGLVVIIVGGWVVLASKLKRIRPWLTLASLSTALIGGELVLIEGWGTEYVLTPSKTISKITVFGHAGIALIVSGIFFMIFYVLKKSRTQ